MTPIKLAATVALLAASVAMASSKVEFIIETGGNNHADVYESQLDYPAYTPGVTDGSTVLGALGDDLNWAVRVLVHGQYNEASQDANRHDDFDPNTQMPTGPGDFRYPLGMANIVFDIVVTDMADNVIQIGHGGPGVAGFHSTINDGDADGVRGDGGLNPDPLENAAFASVYNVDGNGANGGRLIDTRGNGGPNMDYFWHPSAQGHPAASTADPGWLVGAGAGYKDFVPADYVAGVGMFGSLNIDGSGCGTGLVLDAASPQPVVEGQISTSGPAFQAETMYKIKVVADTTGNNILHGEVNCSTGSFGPWGSFATKVNEIVNAGVDNVVAETTFRTGPSSGAQIVARHIFYNNSYYDGNNAAINATPNGGTNHDHDDDAIDPSKSALLPGAGQATVANYTGFTKGITGVMFDVAGATGPITQGDFSFVNQGRLGTGAAALAPSGFLVRPGEGVGGSDRVVITFADGAMLNGWLESTVGTGFGLPAADVSYWGNAAGDGQSVQGQNILVDGTDIADARDNGHTILNRALVDDAYDYTKDSLVDGADIVYARDNQKTILNAVRLITR